MGEGSPGHWGDGGFGAAGGAGGLAFAPLVLRKAGLRPLQRRCTSIDRALHHRVIYSTRKGQGAWGNK